MKAYEWEQYIQGEIFPVSAYLPAMIIAFDCAGHRSCSLKKYARSPSDPASRASEILIKRNWSIMTIQFITGHKNARLRTSVMECSLLLGISAFPTYGSIQSWSLKW